MNTSGIPNSVGGGVIQQFLRQTDSEVNSLRNIIADYRGEGFNSLGKEVEGVVDGGAAAIGTFFGALGSLAHDKNCSSPPQHMGSHRGQTSDVGNGLANAGMPKKDSDLPIHGAGALESYAEDETDLKVMARKDRQMIPPGMVLVELKDRTQGDTAAAMVQELYAALPNGESRALLIKELENSDGRIAFVPEEDRVDLLDVWKGRMTEARRRVEQSFKSEGQRRRAPRLSFFQFDETGHLMPEEEADSSVDIASSSSAEICSSICN